MTGQHVTYINGQRCTTTESKRPAIASPGGTRATGSLGFARRLLHGVNTGNHRTSTGCISVVEHKEKLEYRKVRVGEIAGIVVDNRLLLYTQPWVQKTLLE